MPWGTDTECVLGVEEAGVVGGQGGSDLSSEVRPARGGEEGMGEGTRGPPPLSLGQWDPIEAVKQDTEKTAATSLSVERTEALGEHPVVRGEAFLLLAAVSAWLRAMTLRCFQQQADSHSAVHASSQSWSGRTMACAARTDDRDELAAPCRACLGKTSSSALHSSLSASLPLPS